MVFSADFGGHILALQGLAAPGAFHLQRFFDAALAYHGVLETAGVPTGLMDHAIELLNDPYHGPEFNHTVAEATLASLRGQGLFPREGEELRQFHDRLVELRRTNQAISSASSLPVPLARLFLPRERLMEIWHSPSAVRELIPSYKLLYPLSELSLERGAEVYLAIDEVERRQVALKIYRTYRVVEGIPLGGLFNEMRFQADPVSEDILKVHQAGRTRGGDPYIVLELMQGGTLRSYMENRMPQEIAFPASLPLVRKILRPVVAIHQAGIIHRDLKPENFLLDQTSARLKLADFGISIRTSEIGLVDPDVGTPQYRPPEVSLEGAVDDLRRDVFSLGLILYQAVTGLPVYRIRGLSAGSPPSRVQPSAAIPDGLDRIILRAIAADPAARYPSAVELSADLEGRFG